VINETDETLIERPLFSFEIIVDLSVLGEGKDTYNLIWKRGEGLGIESKKRVAAGKTTHLDKIKDDIPTKAHQLEGVVSQQDDWPPESWKKISIDIVGMPEDEAEASTICRKSIQPPKSYARPHKINKYYDCKQTNKMKSIVKRGPTSAKPYECEQANSKKSLFSRFTRSISFSSQERQYLRAQADNNDNEDYVVITEDQEEKPEMMRNQSLFKFDIDNRNCDTRSPPFSIIFSPMPYSDEVIEGVENFSSNNVLGNTNSVQNSTVHNLPSSSSSTSNRAKQRGYRESSISITDSHWSSSTDTHAESRLPRRPKSRNSRI
jgi:hypothetical protein